MDNELNATQAFKTAANPLARQRGRPVGSTHGHISLPVMKKMSWWHHSIIDWMLANPSGKLYQCARDMNCTREWLYKIINCDLFKSEFEARRKGFNHEMLGTVQEKLHGLAMQSVDRLAEGVADGTASMNETANAGRLALQTLGYLSVGSGNNNPAGAQVVNVNVVGGDVLEKARETMKKAGTQNTTTVEGEKTS